MKLARYAAEAPSTSTTFASCSGQLVLVSRRAARKPRRHREHAERHARDGLHPAAAQEPPHACGNTKNATAAY